MPLPSQSARPQSRNTHMYRRRRGRRLQLLAILLTLLVLTVGTWTWLRGDTDPDSSNAAAQATQPAQDQSPAAESASHGSLTHQSREDQRAPRIAMGEPIPDQYQPEPRRSETSPTARRLPNAAPPSRETPREAEPREAERAGASEPTQAASPRPGSSPAQERVQNRIRAGMDQLASNRPIEARQTLTQALLTPGIDRQSARDIRATLAELNERLLFGREITEGDPFVFGYTIRPGDTLARIASRQDTNVDWRFIQRINGISRPEAIRAGQRIKLVQGPFHAVVVKDDYRLDLFVGEGSDRVYVRSFDVGLGEHNSTPVGLFRVRENSKLINPAWTNPRTGERFTANDPDNPIGDRWIGLEGITESIRDLAGYGIHGTIDPDSIGRQESMGCIRLGNDDVELLYEMLVEGKSTVEIVDRSYTVSAR